MSYDDLAPIDHSRSLYAARYATLVPRAVGMCINYGNVVQEVDEASTMEEVEKIIARHKHNIEKITVKEEASE